MPNYTFYKLEMVREKSARYDVSKKFTTPEEVEQFCRTVLELDKKAEEYFYIVTVDTKYKVSGIFEISHGSLNATIVHPREIFKRVLLANASKFFMVHNHPSGDVNPSKEDRNITKRLKDCGDMLGVEILDHIIIGYDRMFSFKEECLL